jgi:hypothetical protein
LDRGHKKQQHKTELVFWFATLNCVLRSYAVQSVRVMLRSCFAPSSCATCFKQAADAADVDAAAAAYAMPDMLCNY